MGRAHQENTATFAEVFTTSSISCQQNRSAGSHDNRLMLYFQGVKIYIPDGCKQETLLVSASNDAVDSVAERLLNCTTSSFGALTF